MPDKRRLAAMLAEEVDRIARREAAARGVNVAEPYRLMAATCGVLSDQALLGEATTAVRVRLERGEE